MKRLLQLERRRNFFMACLRAATFCLLFALTAVVTAQPPPTTTASQPAVTSVPPFIGTNSETWEEFAVGELPTGTSILGGIATISGDEMLTEHRFRMCSVWGLPSDGRILMDSDRPNDTVTFSFSQPVSAFGAYWGSGLHCFGDPPSILTFQDVNGNVIGSDSFNYQGDGTLNWHGYTFSTPVKTITRTAGDHQEGVAIDGLQANVAGTPTPTPSPSPTPSPTPTPSPSPTPTPTPTPTPPIILKIISITHPASNTIHLNCVGAPSAINRIEWSPNLGPGSFNTLGSVMANGSGAFQYDDMNAGTKKFYRVAYP
jgi:hypothetical protein